MICGVDEAGRGSLIGPLVIAFVFARKPGLLSFIKKDSKKFSKGKREELFKRIVEKADFIFVEKIMPTEIDKRNINSIERQLIEKVIKIIKPKKIFIDLFEHSPSKIEEVGKKHGVDVVAEHKADEKYSIVSAASIVAKVVRDKEIEKISKKVGFFGSGYPSDQRTVEFVKKHYEEIKPYLRKKWKTLDRIKNQKKIFEF